MPRSVFQVMVIIDNPTDFPSWPLQQKCERYRQLVRWHEEYMPPLFRKGIISHAWGSSQLLSRFDATTSLGPLIAIFNVKSWNEFDKLLEADPLRALSAYVTAPLGSLVDDQRTDMERTEYAREQLFRGKTTRQLSLLEEHRAQFNGPPEFLGKFKYRNPPNQKTLLNARRKVNDPLEIMVIGMNPDNLIETWTDAHAFILYEKVNWFFDYMAMMISRGYVTHAWGTHDFCNVSAMSVNSKGSAAIYRVRDMEEFHIVYNLDPLREWAKFHTILLRPIADQCDADRQRLATAERMLLNNK